MNSAKNSSSFQRELLYLKELLLRFELKQKSAPSEGQALEYKRRCNTIRLRIQTLEGQA